MNCRAVLLVLFLLVTPVWAGPNHVEVVEGFFMALHENRYHDAWSFCDAGTQSYFASEVATAFKLNEADVLALFRANDPKIKWFWDNFRKNANTDQVYSKCKYWLISSDGDSATVGCKLPGGSEQLELLAIRRDGRWGFDYFTTFIAE